MDKVFGGLPYALAITLTTSFTKGFGTFTDRVFISPSVPTDNFDLPMDNWFTICTDRTDGQGFWGATLCPCNNANYLIHERILYIYRSCIHFFIRTDGQHLLPMENWFTIGTDRTDGQGFWGLPYALAIMLTTSFTKGFCTNTDRVFISPSVPTDTDGSNNFTKLTVGMLASVLDNPPYQRARPANCGKTFIIDPLNSIYRTFFNPATTTFAWLGAQNAEIMTSNL